MAARTAFPHARLSGKQQALASVRGLVYRGPLRATPPLRVTFPRLKRALRAGARPIPGYDVLDQGAGVVQVDRAWEALKKIAAAPEVAATLADAVDLLIGPGGRQQ